MKTKLVGLSLFIGSGIASAQIPDDVKSCVLTVSFVSAGVSCDGGKLISLKTFDDAENRVDFTATVSFYSKVLIEKGLSLRACNANLSACIFTK